MDVLFLIFLCIISGLARNDNHGGSLSEFSMTALSRDARKARMLELRN